MLWLRRGAKPHADCAVRGANPGAQPARADEAAAACVHALFPSIYRPLPFLFPSSSLPLPSSSLPLLCYPLLAAPLLSRLGRMKLRRHVFTLLDRSLLLSEAKLELGVKMHDAVRGSLLRAG